MTSNAIAPRFGGGTGLVSRDALKGALNNAAMTMPRVGGDKQFLKMDKGNGDWIYGQDETVVEDDSLWAANPASFLHGYISWDKNQQVEGEVMVAISRPLPDVGSLRINGSPDGGPSGEHGWQFQMAVDMVCISGADAGTIVQYKQSSVGALKALGSLTDGIGGQLEADADEIVPVIKMKSDSYKHKKWGRINNPIFEIVEWRTMDDNSPTAEAKEEAAPRTRTARAAAPEPDTSGEAGDAELAREYEATAAAQTADTPRRRVRR